MWRRTLLKPQSSAIAGTWLYARLSSALTAFERVSIPPEQAFDRRVGGPVLFVPILDVMLKRRTDGFDRLAEIRYCGGIEPFLNTLDAQRTTYQAQRMLVATQLVGPSNRVALDRSLGGDSEFEAVPPRQGTPLPPIDATGSGAIVMPKWRIAAPADKPRRGRSASRSSTGTPATGQANPWIARIVRC
ncbi:TolC family protein [Sphingomonas koreensis]|jgi:hypothetical protein|uniref:TolC family protein n=1 Tax=Sphingomonas koreensis TaxID=93064 RepID=UPI000F73853E|nr:TolC family protein [Sphingomonas koreensis]MDC7808765.1 TolC family protein [Sphingomonas koreensis]RSY59859.1 TolC family protein [Sphingomonas koreensis]